MNFLLRTYSWMSLLENTGLLNTFFQKIGLIALVNAVFGTDLTYFHMINTQGAVVLGMDWIETGAPPPTGTHPTIIFFVISRPPYWNSLNTS